MSTMSTMSTSAHAGRAPKGFTLVELMVVVVIIGILMGLLLAGLGAVRARARVTVIKSEIGQLQMALENYKTEYGAYPPDFAYVSHPDIALRNAAQDEVIRHLRKAFPRYPLPAPDPATEDDLAWQTFQIHVLTNYNIDVDGFDAASALVFWLGGLPETAATTGNWIPAGFHADPTFPFKPGRPRTKALFDFDAGRLARQEPDPTGVTRYLHYYPARVEAPYVYFKARRIGANWHYGYSATDQCTYPVPPTFPPVYPYGNGDYCVPYRDPADPPFWREHEKFQIISAGPDGEFGSAIPNGPPPNYRLSKNAQGGFSQADYDNITNFSKGKLEDEIE